MATQENLDLAQTLYVAYYGRPADKAGLEFWADEIEASGAAAVVSVFGNSEEYVARFGDHSSEELVNSIYQQAFNRDADEGGLAFYTEKLESGELDLASIALTIVENAANDDAQDATVLENKVAAANAFTAAAGNDYAGNDAADYAAEFLASVGETAATEQQIADAVAGIPAEGDGGEQPAPGGETVRLTQQADDLQGADGVDTTFVAPVTQNETGSGALANTFETGDVLDGGADSTNVLRADLIASGAVSDSWAPAISAETTNIQEVYLRAQATRVDNNADNTTFGATVDAEKMVGVEQWWSDNSRADVRIEDIRTRPVDTTFGMESTDPEVGFEAYFNPLFMDGDLNAESALTIEVAEIDGDVVLVENELENITVNTLRFTLDGEDYVLESEAMQAANTWAELEAAIAVELEAADLGDLAVSHLGEGRFGIIDEQGREFSQNGGLNIDFGNTDVRNTFNTGLEVEEGPTETTLILDGAGNGSRGGDVNIAAMSGDRGVEVFNVEVDRSSHLKSMRSENNPNSVVDSFAAEQQLEEVYLTHVEGGAQGTFQLGARTVDELGVSTTIDDRLSISTERDGEDEINDEGVNVANSGLRDVRVFDATGYSSEIKLAAELSINVFDKYLADAIDTDETVQFSYLLGDGGNNLSLTVDNEIASDPDFALEIVGGDSNDRVNLTDLAVKNSTSVDLEAGDENTVEINTTTGANADEDGNYETVSSDVEYTAAQTAFGEFTNINRLVIAGENDTRQNIVNGNMTAIDGQEIVIATDGSIDDVDVVSAANTDIVAARIDTELTISGKNQTLGSQNNNNDQFVGIVNVLNTRPIPTQNNLEVDLDNTARLNGELTVEEFNIGTTAGGTSAVSVLDLTSSGRRNVENLVQSATLAGVNTVNLDGTQNLDLHIASMSSGNSVVDGSDLGGDLDLVMNSSNLNGAGDVLTGTDATTDTLTVYGDDAQATVTGFETLQLGLASGNQFTGDLEGFSGTFNAGAVSGVEQYSIAALDDAAELINLSGSEVINVSASDADQDLTLIASDRSGGNEITVNFAGDYSSDLSVQDYRTVNLGLATGDYDFTLDLETEDGTNAGNTYARTLNITGGGLDSDGEVNSTLDIGALDTALTRIDLSEYAGSLIDASWDDADGSNATIVVNQYDFTFNLSVDGDDTTATDFTSRFVFTEDAESVWTINNFQQLIQEDASTENNFTILDFSQLGLSSRADINIDREVGSASIDGFDGDTFAEGDDSTAVITANDDGYEFTVVLTGLDGATDLLGDNFNFA
ncbi:DUF4214 domain-containing protein [Halomonas sp.]|uniref:DUF4214 domain-containing protein n=1 Tax=Halomonas sp. TaxID=1486246 RepID=UPI003A94A57E